MKSGFQLMDKKQTGLTGSMTLSVLALCLMSSAMIGCKASEFNMGEKAEAQVTPATEGSSPKPDESAPGRDSSQCRQQTDWKLYQPNAENKMFFKANVGVYQSRDTAVQTYDYYSTSTHNHVGPKAQNDALFFYLVKASDGLYLFFHHDMDNSPDRDWQNLKLSVELKNAGTQAHFVVKDDPKHELDIFEQKGNLFNVTLSHDDNSDGAVIGPLSGDDIEIHVTGISGNRIDKKTSGVGSSEDSDKETVHLIANNKGDLQNFILKLQNTVVCP
jgi:hypothetical protein